MKLMNKEHFKYLYDSNKKYIFVSLLICFLALPFTMITTDMYHGDAKDLIIVINIIAMMLGFVISFLAPIKLFSYIQKKRSANLYFSLPITRKEMFVTDSIFGIIASIIPVISMYLLATCVIGLRTGQSILPAFSSLAFIVFFMICTFAMITFICNKCQNILDTFIIGGAYTVTPLIIYICTNIFVESQVRSISLGYGNYTSEFLQYLIEYISLPGCSINYLTNLIENDTSFFPIIWWCIVSVVFMVIAFKSFINREAESADSYTKSYACFPFIIVSVVCSLILGVSTTMELSTIAFYAFVFIIYLVMYFFSIRKIEFNVKVIGIYGLMIACCLGFGVLFQVTRGFGTVHEIPSINAKEYIYADISYYGSPNTNSYSFRTKNTYGLKETMQLHKDIVKIAETTKTKTDNQGAIVYNENTNYETKQYFDITIRYYLKGQKTVERSYYITNDKGCTKAKQIVEVYRTSNNTCLSYY